MRDWWHRLTYPLRLLSARRRREAEEGLEAEIAAHLEAQIAENLENGMSAEEARRAAYRRFGNPVVYREQCRESWGVGPLDRIRLDLRYGARMLAKKPVASLVAILSLGVGIGANTAVFTVLKAAVYGAPPLYQDPDRLVTLWETAPGEPGVRRDVSSPSYRAWRTEGGPFEGLAAARPGVGVSLGLADYPVQMVAQLSSADLLSVLGVRPLLGRYFLPSDERTGADPVVVLGYGAWQGRFGADPDVVGRSIAIDGRKHTVVGVLPRGFWFAQGGTDLWLPRPSSHTPGLDDHSLRVVARLRRGVRLEEARAALEARARHLGQLYPTRKPGWSARVDPVRTIDAFGGAVPPGFLQLFGALSLVLLIACVNVASVVVARGSARQGEIAIRAALGASRWRLVRQLLTESLLLAGLGGLLGLLVALWGLGLIGHYAPGDLSRSMDLHFDGVALTFAAAAALLTGLVAGAAPAVADSRVEVSSLLNQGSNAHGTGAPRQRLRSGLVVAEVALTLILLVGVGLLVRSYSSLKQMDPGFDPDGLMTFLVQLPEKEYSTPLASGRAEDEDTDRVEISPRVDQRFEEVLRRIQRVPGVESVGAAYELPPASGGPRLVEPGGVRGTGLSESSRAVAFNPVSPRLFETLRVPLLVGRGFTAQDTAEAPWVAVVNQALAARYWPSQNPIGRSIRLTSPAGERPWTVVGVVADLRNDGMSRHAVPELYVPTLQQARTTIAGLRASRLETLVVVRSASPSEALGTALRKAVAEVDPRLAIADLTTMRARLDGAAEEVLFATFLNGPILLFALGLTAIGIYGALSFSVSRRVREIGIRIAVGAGPLRLLRHVMGDTLALAVVGMAVGTVGALALRHLLAATLFGTVPIDPLLIGGSWLLLMAVALLASYMPARRATRVDPVKALRYE